MSDIGREVSENGNVEPPLSALIFLGTGCSSAVLNALCFIQPSDPPCHVCSQFLSIPPDQNPNYRCNTSLLIDYCSSEGKHKYILIDVGKTFREQVDSIILTHEHADAVLGLHDIRIVQPFSPTNDIDPTLIYLTQHSMDSLAIKFPYLVQKKLKPGQEVRCVAQLDWKIIESDCTKPFLASELQFSPLPVMHGKDYACLGFLFGEKSKVAYISDVSRFFHLRNTIFQKMTLDAVKRLSLKRALLIGMTHEFDHHIDNEFLREWSRREGIPVQLAHDGLRISIDL